MRKKILILGVTGMAGHALFRYLSAQKDLDVHATARTRRGLDRWFSPAAADRILSSVEADDFDTVAGALSSLLPEVVINCIGIIKQSPLANDPLTATAINSVFPRRLSHFCRSAGARLIHLSTDCVFSGTRGGYDENDTPDADDLYGRSKLLGEVVEPHCLTVRKSLIGHELKEKRGLMEWFLAQEGKVDGFAGAVFTGLPTIELARILAEYIIPNENLNGLYHVGSEPISKYELLKLVAGRYGKKIEIIPRHEFQKNRALDSAAFRRLTGYRPPSWPELVDRMYRDHAASPRDRTSN